MLKKTVLFIIILLNLVSLSIPKVAEATSKNQTEGCLSITSMIVIGTSQQGQYYHIEVYGNNLSNVSLEVTNKGTVINSSINLETITADYLEFQFEYDPGTRVYDMTLTNNKIGCSVDGIIDVSPPIIPGISPGGD